LLVLVSRFDSRAVRAFFLPLFLVNRDTEVFFRGPDYFDVLSGKKEKLSPLIGW
jgi:hypothetical protein